MSGDLSNAYVVLGSVSLFILFDEYIGNLVLTVSNATDLCLYSCMCVKVPFCSGFSNAEQTVPEHQRPHLFIYSNPACRFCEPPKVGIGTHIEKNLL